MKKEFSICAASVLLGFITNTAFAINLDGQSYIEGKVGNSWAKGKNVKAKPTTTDIQFPDDSFNSDSLVGGAALGYQFNAAIVPIRLEAEYLRRSQFEYNTTATSFFSNNVPFKSDIKNQTALANLFVDVPLTDRLMVFVGGGIGVNFNHTHTKVTIPGQTITRDDSLNSFAWMASAGAGAKANDWLTFTVNYRYSDLGDIRWKSFTTMKEQINSDSFRAHEVMIGVRMTAPN